MYHHGDLVADVTSADTTLTVCGVVVYCCGRFGAALVASTAPGPFSEWDGNKYVTFIKVGDELMKVITVATVSNPDPESSAPCQTLTVGRGLDGSAPAKAVAGSPLLAPVYVSTPTWGDGPGASGRLRYQADYASAYAWQSLANFTVDSVEQLGYDGAWFDSFSPSEVRNGADPAGNKVSAWNPVTSAPYTPQEAYDAQQARLQRVWKEVHARLGRYPVIWANNFENWFPDAKRPGDRIFMVNSTGTRPFDGCSLESWTAGFHGSCFAQTDRPGVTNLVVYSDEDAWVSRVNTMIDAARLRLSVAAMTGSAGCQSPLQTFLPAANRTQLDLLHYASFLMSVRQAGGDTTNRTATGPLVGTSMFFTDDGIGLAEGRLWEPYTWDLGPPLIPVPSGLNVTAFRVTAPAVPGVYVRYFASAVAVVCPGPAAAMTPTLLDRGPYTDPLTGETGILSVRMQGQTGRILLRQ